MDQRVSDSNEPVDGDEAQADENITKGDNTACVERIEAMAMWRIHKKSKKKMHKFLI